MSAVGRIGEFDPEFEDWTQYVECMGFYFTANDIAAPKQKATFLAAIGPSTYKLLRTLISPARLEVKTMDELAKVLEDH